MADTGDAMINGLTEALRDRLTELAAQTPRSDHADETDPLWESYSHDPRALRLLDHLSSHLADSVGRTTATPDLATLRSIYEQRTTAQTASVATPDPARIASLASRSTIPAPQSSLLGRSVDEHLSLRERATLTILEMRYNSARDRLEDATTALAEAQLRLDTNTTTGPCDYAIAQALYHKAKTDNDTALASLSEHMTGR